jgi:phospholipase A1
LKDEYNKLLEKKYVLLPHKGTYLLPFSHNDNPNSNTFKTIEDENKDRGTFYERTETEFQISFLILTNKNIFNTNFNTFIGYTHRAYWQVYNKDWSRPFRETNYMPEIFARYVFDKPPKILNAHYIGYDIGFVHQSNGQVQELSRSWNRIFSRFTFLAGSTFFNFTLWYRLPESKDENENPYMYKYRGYGEIDMRHEFGELDLRLRILPVVDERRCHAHHSSSSPSAKDSREQALVINCESNPCPIGTGTARGTSELSSSSTSDLFEYVVLSIFDFHYLAQPIQNEELLRKLYIEMDLSSYQISEISGWSRTSISDAMRTHKIQKDGRKGPMPQYGMKKEGTKHVVHKGEQKVIKKMLTLRGKGYSYVSIAEKLNEENIPSKLGKNWNKSTVADIIKRKFKRKV